MGSFPKAEYKFLNVILLFIFLFISTNLVPARVNIKKNSHTKSGEYNCATKFYTRKMPSAYKG